MALKKTPELSQTRRIVMVRHVGQELLVLHNLSTKSCRVSGMIVSRSMPPVHKLCMN
jgi:hypothetical protein